MPFIASPPLTPKTRKIFSAKVITGYRRGKILGFPTLNLTIPSDFNFQPGIYAGWVFIGQTKFMGAFHYGPVPTFDQPDNSLEVFVLNTSFNSTPSQVNFQLVKHLRAIKTFTSPDHLATQIKKDVLLTEEILSTS